VDAKPLEVGHDGLQLAEQAQLAAALRGKEALGHAVLDGQRPAPGLSDDVGGADRARLDQARQGAVVNGFCGHALASKVACRNTAIHTAGNYKTQAPNNCKGLTD